jgi:hypothetical protein
MIFLLICYLSFTIGQRYDTKFFSYSGALSNVRFSDDLMFMYTGSFMDNVRVSYRNLTGYEPLHIIIPSDFPYAFSNTNSYTQSDIYLGGSGANTYMIVIYNTENKIRFYHLTYQRAIHFQTVDLITAYRSIKSTFYTAFLATSTT